MIGHYGADTVRLFMLFASPPEKDLEWSEAGAEGASRFLNRVWRILYRWHLQIGSCTGKAEDFSPAARQLRRRTHQTIRRVTGDIRDRMHLNTAISALMELTNEMYAFDGAIGGNPSSSDLVAMNEAAEALVKMLSPFTPHIAEELWQSLGHDDIVVASRWPEYDEQLAREEELEIPVQVNGKLVARIMVPADSGEEQLSQAALANEKIQARMAGKQLVKSIIVPGRLVNLVVK
jgi:leucyl-tRNA synthetase